MTPGGMEMGKGTETGKGGREGVGWASPAGLYQLGRELGSHPPTHPQCEGADGARTVGEQGCPLSHLQLKGSLPAAAMGRWKRASEEAIVLARPRNNGALEQPGSWRGMQSGRVWNIF